jgi:hypothetical protein
MFRAEDEPVVSRVDYWRHLAEETVVPLELRVGGSPGRVRPWPAGNQPADLGEHDRT